MSYAERSELYRHIERIRNRPLIVYVTSSRSNASAQMASDVIPQFTQQLLALPTEPREIDLLIVSNGGDPVVSWRTISMLRERFDRVGVLLPFAAYSAATLLALGADEIVMHPFSNLGPVDPQLTHQRRVPGQQGQPDAVEAFQFGAEDLTNFLQFVRSDVGISDQKQLALAFELVCREVGAISIGVAKRSSQLALSMGEKLLTMHMPDAAQARVIVEKLNRSFYHHGYPLAPSEAKKIGLPVVLAEGELRSLIWSVWESLETEMESNKAFDPLQVALNSPAGAALVAPVPQLQLPANLPPEILQKVYANVLQQIGVVNIDPVDYNLFQATLESTGCRSEFRTIGKINAARLPDMNITVNVIQISSGWQFIKNA